MKTIAVTRPKGEGGETAQLIRQLGWTPFILHTVELKPNEPSKIITELTNALDEGALDWLIFMSRNGVKYLFDMLSGHRDLLQKLLNQSRILAVGPKTRDALLKRGVREVLIPAKYSSVDIAAFLSRFRMQGRRIALARSSEASDVLAKTLAETGAVVRTLRLYESATPRDMDSVFGFLEGLRKGEFQAVLFTSAVSASNFFKMAESTVAPHEVVELLTSCLVGAIGPVTAKRLRELGIEPSIIPSTYLISEAVRGLVTAYEAKAASVSHGSW